MMEQQAPVRVIEVQPTVTSAPTDFNGWAWSMMDKVAEGSTAVIFALILIWWFSRKTLGNIIDRFNDLLVTLTKATQDNATAQHELTQSIEKIGQEDIKTTRLLAKMSVQLKTLTSLMIEVRSYQTGIPQNRATNYLEVLDADTDEDSDLGN